MAEKKNKKAPAKAAKTAKEAVASSPSGKKGCLFFFAFFLFLLILLVVTGGGVLFFASSSTSGWKAALEEKISGAGSFFASSPSVGEKDSFAIPESMPADEALGRKLIEEAEESYRHKSYEKARNDARIALEKFPFSSPYWHRASELITKCSFAILHSSGDTALEKKRILTRKGDTLNSLGVRYDLTPESIKMGNKNLLKIASNDTPIREGVTLFLYCGKWNIKISNARKRLFVMDGKKPFAIYPIGIADDFGKAETGSISSITAKITKPAWKTGEDLYPPNHPMNILGGFSMEFRGASGKELFRIHGTNREENVGRTIKGPGCISMKNEHIKELFHLIPTGTRVEVIR